MRIKVVLLLCFLNLSVSAANIKVVFIVPDNKGPLFWSLVTDISASVASSLAVDLEIIYSDSDRFSSLNAISAVSQRSDKPDYLIFRPFRGNVAEVFNILERENIKFVTLEQAFIGQEAINVGQPQQKYKNWLGQINYDNRAGGELLTKALVSEYQERLPQKAISITGIGGDFDAVSLDRQAYLSKQSLSNNTFVVNQIFPLHWKKKLIEQRFTSIVKRYPNTNVYWCAGDEMALEVVRQLRKLSLVSKDNPPILVGGFDWLPEALAKIKSGEMAASVGGHFLMGGAAVLKIIDYDKGKDRFIKGAAQYKFELINYTNVDRYITFLEQKHWQKLNYQDYLSSEKNTDVQEFTVENLINQYRLHHHEIK